MALCIYVYERRARPVASDAEIGRKIVENQRIFNEIRRELVHIWPDPVKIHRKPQLSMDFDIKIDDFRLMF